MALVEAKTYFTLAEIFPFLQFLYKMNFKTNDVHNCL